MSINEEIIVSVFCTCYNHENYIRDCLDGFIMQETNFKFEVLVHDDASTDNSAEIIREYEKKYPDIIKPIYQTKNQYSQGVQISTEILLPKANGKYIAFCEGDDYWTDKHKLQKQFNILETHKDCSICIHRVRVYNLKSPRSISYYPKITLQNGVLSGNRLLNLRIIDSVFFQLSSYFLTMDSFKLYCLNRENYYNFPKLGDLSITFFYGCIGNCYYSNDVMSIYRFGVKNSWGERFKKGEALNLKEIKKTKESLKRLNMYTNFNYSEYITKLLLWYEEQESVYWWIYIIKGSNKFSNYLTCHNKINKLCIKKRIFILFSIKFPVLVDIYNRIIHNWKKQ